MDADKDYFTVEMGRLLWKPLRDMLDSEIWTGTDIEYREGTGILSKVFHIKGRPADVHRVKNRIQEWIKNHG
jgi:hypothetical protein